MGVLPLVGTIRTGHAAVAGRPLVGRRLQDLPRHSRLSCEARTPQAGAGWWFRSFSVPCKCGRMDDVHTSAEVRRQIPMVPELSRVDHRRGAPVRRSVAYYRLSVLPLATNQPTPVGEGAIANPRDTSYDEIPRWRDIAVNPQWDDYGDVNKKRRLRLHAQRIVDRGEDFNFEPRTLGKAHRNTMEGQIALEYGYIGKNGNPARRLRSDGWRRWRSAANCSLVSSVRSKPSSTAYGYVRSAKTLGLKRANPTVTHMYRSPLSKGGRGLSGFIR